MGRPRKLDALTKSLSGRIRPEQWVWLNFVADRRFEGETSRTLRWALDQAMTFDQILQSQDPVMELDEMLNPEKYEGPDREEQIAEAEREYETWKREQAIKRAQRKTADAKAPAKKRARTK
jgi:hypothetical protein